MTVFPMIASLLFVAITTFDTLYFPSFIAITFFLLFCSDSESGFHNKQISALKIKCYSAAKFMAHLMLFYCGLQKAGVLIYSRTLSSALP